MGTWREAQTNAEMIKLWAIKKTWSCFLAILDLALYTYCKPLKTIIIAQKNQ
jgi:hypothetical protein